MRALLVFLAAAGLLAAAPPVVEVRVYKGRPTVFIDGKPDALPGFNTFGKAAFDRSMTLAYGNKFSAYFITPAVRPDAWPETRFWRGDRITDTPQGPPWPGLFDLDEQADHVLRGDPDGYLIVRFGLWPPPSWRDAHPQEYFINEEGSPGPAPSLASDVFYDAADRFTAALIRYCESRPWANRVIGYANFGVQEGTHPPLAQHWLFDHGPLMSARWRRFLEAKYGAIEKLRAAYGDRAATFGSVPVPRDKLRGPAPALAGLLYWQSARENQPLRDYLELQRQLFLSRMRSSGEAMHRAAARKVLFLHDALKQTMQGWTNFGFFNYPGGGGGVSWPLAYPEYLAGSGSMDVMSLFGGRGFDGLITPHDYQARGIGGVYEPEGSADSTVLRGRYFYCEMDTRTYVRTKNEIGLARNDREYAANTWRNLATGWTRGFNSYWMEFGAGWFDPPGIRSIIGRQVAAIRESIEWPHETVPGIAMVLDDTAVLETNGSGNLHNEAVMWEQKMGMARCGVPHNIYLLEDLALDHFPAHKVYYFPNLYRVDAARLDLLRRKVFRNGNVVVWGPGSGISDGRSVGIESAARLTGFSFEMLPVNAHRRILVSNFDHPVTRGLRADTVIGGPLSYGPVLLPTDGVELGLAWVKGGFNHTGLAVKEFGKGAAGNGTSGPRGEGDYAAVFSIAANLPADLWRGLARYAGAHVYSETNDVLLADRSVVALHSLQSGKKRIALPGRFHVRDVTGGGEYAREASEIIFDLHAPETRVFVVQ
ncbi:MAG: hypothetical protein IT158_17300 [Bryobacterales bacterium]|nr:hypothetical protein [Bryobacterales bacterium]